MLLKYKQLSVFQKSVFFNSLIMFIWWLAFNPGFFSADSFAVIEMARSGHLTSESTLVWVIFVKFLTLNGTHPEIATLFFSQLLGLSLTILATTLFKGRIALWSSAILCLTPLIGAMGITLWHDIPMTSGFLLAVVGFHRLKLKEPFGYLVFFIGVLLSSFRYNGLPTLVVTLFILFFITKNKKLFAISLFTVLAIGAISIAIDTKFSPEVSTHSDGFINWMRYDLSCYAANSSDDQFFNKQFSERATREFWKSSSACNWFNDSQSFLQRSEFVIEKTPSAWIALAKSKPYFVLSAHMKRNGYLNPIPLYGLPSMPFIHTTIEFPDQGIRFLIPSLSEKLRAYPRIWNFFNFFFGYSGFWLVLILIFAWKKRNPTYLGIGILGVVLNSGLFIFAIISDARFTLYVLVASQLICIGEGLCFITKLLERRRTKYVQGNRGMQ